MAEQPVAGFGGLLRQLRIEGNLTQEELAEAATLSPRSVSDLERGINATARKDTARLLADALHLDGHARALFEAAARGRVPAEEALAAARGDKAGGSAAATRALPRDIASFTGRQDELGQLVAQWAAAAAGGGVVSIHAIGGMAGVGKTAFAVHAAHQLAADFPDGQFFLPLHAHTPGQQPVGPADGLASLLLTAGVPAIQIPPGVDARAARWRDHVAGKKILLLLDDAAGHDQIRPLLPGTPGSLVLITSRRRLAALEDAAVLSLDTLPPGEAAALLARLALRPDLGLPGGPGGQITRLCGYLPLAIGMLGRQLAHHPAWTPAGLAGDLAAARDRLQLMAAENLSVAAAFDLSHQDLTGAQQQLFRRLGLHPGPDIDAHAAAALDDTSPGQARRRLEDLYDQHLITQPAPGRYRFHDLIRQHARVLADAEPADSGAAAGRLLDYYLHTALAASAHITARVHGTRPQAPGAPPACAPPLSTPAQATQWLETERANLHAAAEYAAAHGYQQHAVQIPAAVSGFLRSQGYWDQAAALHRTALTAARRAGDLRGQADALYCLADVHSGADNYPAFIAAARQALALYRDLGIRLNQGDTLNNLGWAQQLTGDYPAAADSFQQALDLFRDLGDQLGQASVLEGLAELRIETGEYPAAADSLQQALELYRDLGEQDSRAFAIHLVATVQRLTGDYPAAAANCRQALELFRKVGDRFNQGFTLDEIGILQQLTGDYPAAAASLHQALDLFRDLGAPYGQAQVHNSLGALHTETSDYPAAAASVNQALDLYCNLGAPHGQAAALNNLGELLSRSSASRQAREHHIRALAIARNIGAPLEEARALEGIGQSHIHDGNPADGATQLRNAVTIYQRIGAPAAQRLQNTLGDLSI
jgi:tetratricopeptide (TPR) repeat protein/transcriptional regulator with XRE-family HTH domain